MKKILLTVLIIAITGFYTSSNAQFLEGKDVQTTISAFANRIKKDVEDDNVKGSISVAIVKRDSIIWSGAYGSADFNNNIEADSTTIYRTGSISKSFTAFLMMQLVQDGTIEVDEQIEKYLPEISEING